MGRGIRSRRRVDRTGAGGFAVEDVGRDEIAELAHLHIFVVCQLQDADGHLGKGRQAQIGPGQRGGLPEFRLQGLLQMASPASRQ